MPGPKVTTKHPDYLASEAHWKRCRDFQAGSDAVKAGDYLPKPAGMSDEDYAFYKDRALYLNCLARTIEALGGAIFRREPTVETPNAIEDHLEDVTLRDEPLDVVALRIVKEQLTVGRYGILLDMPEGAADGARPYWVTIPAERIINWRTGRVGADPEQLVMVVIEESAPAGGDDPFSHETKVQYRELSLETGAYQSRVWTAGHSDSAEWVPGPWVIPMRRGQPLDFIPFTFVGTDGITADVTRPPLLDLVDVSISHYRNSADHEHGLFLVAIPTPWASGVAGEGTLRIGPSVVWRLTENGRAGMLEFSGAGLEAIREAMASKERQMAMLGARLLEDPHAAAPATATEVRVKHGGETASLRTIAGAASAALTRLLRWHVWWFTGTGELPLDVAAKLCTEFFEVKATPEEIKTALLAVQAGKMAFETFYQILEKGGWAREGVSAKDELEEIERETPPPVDDPDPDLDPADNPEDDPDPRPGIPPPA